MKRVTIPLLAAAAGCEVLGDDLDELADCLGEESALPLIVVSEPPDVDIEVPIGAVDSPEEWEDGGKVRVEVWDCIDLAWWNPARPEKIVQVWVDETECELYERIFVEHWECGSHEGADAPFRDWDGDGITAWEGDCDDEDPATGGDLDLDGTSDCVDDDGDGLSEEEGDPDDADPEVT